MDIKKTIKNIKLFKTKNTWAQAISKKRDKQSKNRKKSEKAKRVKSKIANNFHASFTHKNAKIHI